MRLPSSGTEVSRSGDPLTVTDKQREYLDALVAAGVRPSSELSALTIGSYVCQARYAKQTDQALWAFVSPLVRNDVRAGHPSVSSPPSARVDSPHAAHADQLPAAGGGSPATTRVGTPESPPAEAVDAATADYIRIATDRLC